MSKMNATKSEQLGMSFSTASGRLRKMVMFSLVQQCNRDICYRCNERIESVDNFSIEHMEEWLHSEDPYELFFDLNNITFSHHDCNSLSRRKQYKKLGKSGIKGVSYDNSKQRSKRWKAVAYFESKRYNLGRFETSKEAGLAYDEFVTEKYGDKALTNKKLGLL